MAGKGDMRRPRFVPKEEWDNNWDLAFKKNKKQKYNKTKSKINNKIHQN